MLQAGLQATAALVSFAALHNQILSMRNNHFTRISCNNRACRQRSVLSRSSSPRELKFVYAVGHG